MTEREYVETIKLAAERYQAALHGDREAMREDILRWERIKQALSPSTAIELCKLWLERQ